MASKARLRMTERKYIGLNHVTTLSLIIGSDVTSAGLAFMFGLNHEITFLSLSCHIMSAGLAFTFGLNHVITFFYCILLCNECWFNVCRLWHEKSRNHLIFYLTLM